MDDSSIEGEDAWPLAITTEIFFMYPNQKNVLISFACCGTALHEVVVLSSCEIKKNAYPWLNKIKALGYVSLLLARQEAHVPLSPMVAIDRMPNDQQLTILGWALFDDLLTNDEG